MNLYRPSTSPTVVAIPRTCSRCGNRFTSVEPKYVCPECRKPKPANRALPGQHLSPRERQIVALIRQAKPNKQIAYELCLTEGTVKEYLNQIYRKVKLPNRTALALWQPPVEQ
jgi:DNA-binding NarL/FixJ family response regulator